MQRKICIKKRPFNISKSYQWLSSCNLDGAIVVFTGKVRSYNIQDQVFLMNLEHYPKMTEKIFKTIIKEANYRWIINRVMIIHRIGKLFSGENIVLVGVSCLDRDSAFSAAEFIMDHIKNYAPFWKKETTINGDRWIDTNHKDSIALNRWKTEHIFQ